MTYPTEPTDQMLDAPLYREHEFEDDEERADMEDDDQGGDY